MTAGRRKIDRAARLLCAVALLFLSFAHLPGFAAPSGPGQSSEYMLPDGTFASLCLTHSSDEKPVAALKCELCCLTSAVYLPLPSGGASQSLDLVSLANPLFAVQGVPCGHAIERARARSPPEFV